MGVTTSLNQFARSVGGTIGVAIMGSILVRRLNNELAAGLPDDVRAGAPEPLLDALGNPRILLDEGALSRLRDDGFTPVFGPGSDGLFEATIVSMKDALASSITDVFAIATVLMGISMLIIFLLPEIPFRREAAAPAAPPIGDESPTTPTASAHLRAASQAARAERDGV
jgi:hypothetical protein